MLHALQSANAFCERKKNAPSKFSSHGAVPTDFWNADSATSNAGRQAQLLRTALRIAPCGSVVYSTCALSRIENDNVVEAVLRSSPGWQRENLNKQTSAEQQVLAALGKGVQVDETQYGSQLLPDQGGWGPIYWSLLNYAG